MKPETMWKIFNLVLAALIMPLAGWVWSVNVEVAQLRNDLGDLENNFAQIEDKVKDLDDASRTLIGVERDVQHIREILDRIETLVAQ
jgi:hypothetical protein